MGRRGPPPKPSAVKKLEGTHRKDRAAPNEMKPPPGIPDRPAWLDKEARAEWDRVIPQLHELGVLADIDRAMLADYCAAHSLAVSATEKYQKEGLILQTPFGPQKHPMINVAKEARAQARLLAAEFGLSAASRSRVSMKPKADKKDDTEDFLFQGPRLVKADGSTQ